MMRVRCFRHTLAMLRADTQEPADFTLPAVSGSCGVSESVCGSAFDVCDSEALGVSSVLGVSAALDALSEAALSLPSCWRSVWDGGGLLGPVWALASGGTFGCRCVGCVEGEGSVDFAGSGDVDADAEVGGAG
jgi:hypothetical protein